MRDLTGGRQSHGPQWAGLSVLIIMPSLV
jgi:hypothetical protein